MIVNKITSSAIADFLNCELYGQDHLVQGISTLDAPSDFTLSFVTNLNTELNKDREKTYLAPINFKYEPSKFSIIKVKNPRLSFAKVLNEFFSKKQIAVIENSVNFQKNCTISKDVSIGHNTVIGNNVKIGQNTIIKNNVVIADNTLIGENCYIKSGSIIGEDGFGFVNDTENDDIPLRIEHLGNVVIGNNVEIGASCVIARATIDSTVINNNVKIDDLVFIAHNCIIGAKTMIAAHVEISGSVKIGESCWIGPNSSIVQKVIIGNNVTLDIGSLVKNNIADRITLSSLESVNLRSLVKMKKILDI